MNSRQRVFSTARGEKTDCFPVTPYNGNFAITAAGYDMSLCQRDGRLLAEAQRKAWELVGQDAVVAQSDQYYLAEALGVKTEFRPFSLPVSKGPALGSLEEASKLRVPDPYTDGRMYVYIEAVGLLRQHFGDAVAVRAPGAGPFALAGHMLGIDNFITTLSVAELEEDEDTIARILDMMEILYESHYRYVEACVIAGADIVQCADSLASLDMISPALYEKYAFPYEKRFFQRIARLEDRYEFLTLLHICGNNTPILHRLADTGCDILEVDYKVELSLCKKEIGSRVCLMGNINPAGAIYSGTPDEVAAEAETAMDAAGAGGRFFLGSGCEVAVKAPAENVRRLVEAGHHRAPWAVLV